MARVSMWQLEGYPVTKLTRVDWDGMTMEWESGGPNLFYLSASVDSLVKSLCRPN